MREDLTGKIYADGNVTVLGLKEIKNRHAIYYCRCEECGNTFTAYDNNLKAKKVKHCPSCRAKAAGKTQRLKFEKGERKGNCIVLEPDEEKIAASSETNVFWKCKCDCGRIFSAKGTKLKNGTVTCCPECNKVLIGFHGMTGTKFYTTWQDMKDRCRNPKNKQYKDYGGRGITYDPRWESFVNFKDDMYDSYLAHEATHDSTTLDKIDNDKGYCKDNCRWATMKEQERNKRTSDKYKVTGYDDLLTIPDIVDMGISDKDLSINTIYTRMRKGWDINDAIVSPRRAEAKNMITFDKSIIGKKEDPGYSNSDYRYFNNY